MSVCVLPRTGAAGPTSLVPAVHGSKILRYHWLKVNKEASLENYRNVVWEIDKKRREAEMLG